LTRARTKVGDYAFTTLYPHVGVVEYEDYTQISIADLPGLLSDPTQGLGIGFLRHIERSKIIIFVIDLSLNEPLQQFYDMKKILEIYDPNIFQTKPFILVGSKVDKEEAKNKLKSLDDNFNLPIIPISSNEKINITKLLIYLRSVYDKLIK
jgi:GTPase